MIIGGAQQFLWQAGHRHRSPLIGYRIAGDGGRVRILRQMNQLDVPQLEQLLVLGHLLLPLLDVLAHELNLTLDHLLMQLVRRVQTRRYVPELFASSKILLKLLRQLLLPLRI